MVAILLIPFAFLAFTSFITCFGLIMQTSDNKIRTALMLTMFLLMYYTVKLALITNGGI